MMKQSIKHEIQEDEAYPLVPQLDDLNRMLSDALRAICLIRDKAGPELFPAVHGQSWFDTGKEISEYIWDDEWSLEFRKRVNRDHSREVRKHFKDGDWVFGIGENKGCSMVFTGNSDDFQPFSYLDNYDPANFRVATEVEIQKTHCKFH